MAPVVVDHPLVRCHLTQLRKTTTQPAEFRLLVQRLAVLLAYEATKDLVTSSQTVETPLAKAEGEQLDQRIGLIPILRAGLGLVDPVLNLIPTAEVWHLGLYRDEATARPVRYYENLPKQRPVDVALILDPMLATGGSAVAALEVLSEWRVPLIKILSVLAAREGLDCVLSAYPNVQVYVCGIDPVLDERKFIVPGLGDAGDRIFNTQGGE